LSTTYRAADLVLGDDKNNTRQLGLARPEQALASHPILGRGNGGRDTPGFIIRDPSQAHQNPVPLQTANQGACVCSWQFKSIFLISASCFLGSRVPKKPDCSCFVSWSLGLNLMVL
jgi:hypothetical protein